VTSVEPMNAAQGRSLWSPAVAGEPIVAVTTAKLMEDDPWNLPT
jgi:hypothetical protein